MCLILDANMFGAFLNSENDDMKPVRRWMEKSGKIAYSPAGKLKQELDDYPKARTLFRAYDQRGKLKSFSADDVKEKEASLGGLRSNDPHVIALAKVSKVRLLVSSDQRLHEDFKEIVGGSVYQKKNHQHLLTDDLCP